MGMDCRLENRWILSAILGWTLLWVMAALWLQLEAYLTLIRGTTPQAAFTPYLPPSWPALGNLETQLACAAAQPRCVGWN